MSSVLRHPWSVTAGDDVGIGMSTEPQPRSFVTGADGFIGSRLVSALLDRGHSVRALLRPGKQPTRLAGMRNRKELELVNGDICTSPTLLGGQSVDYVFHLAAAQLAVPESTYERINHGGMKNLVKQVQRDAPGLRRFVYVSSLAAAGPSLDGRPLNEDAEEKPVSRYGQSKLAAERALAAADSPALPFTILRPSTVIGSGTRGFVAGVLMAARRGVRIEFTSSTRLLSVVYVDDLIEAILLSASAAEALNKTYFVSADDPIEVNDLLARALEVVKTRPRVTLRLGSRSRYALGVIGELVGAISRTRPVFTRDKWRESRQPNWICSSARIQRDLGWQPRVHSDGLAALLMQAESPHGEEPVVAGIG